jgi:hypothetical protein
MNARRSLEVLVAAGACVMAGCGSTASTTAANPILDPTQEHYGHTDDDWGAQWFKWLFEMPESAGDAGADAGAPNCINPLQDPTGIECGYNQTSAEVFFLAGAVSGTVTRDQCKVPAGKAILFPIFNADGDNAGLAPNMQSNDMGLMGQVQGQLDGVPVSAMSASFDGTAITDLARFRTQITKFTYTLPPEPNFYTCIGQSGVTGVVDPSYAAGYYVLLAPPRSGTHTVKFAVNSPNTMPQTVFDVTYHLTVEQ